MHSYLLLAQQGEVEQNLKRFSIGGQNDNLRYSAVQSFGGCKEMSHTSAEKIGQNTFVGALLKWLEL